MSENVPVNPNDPRTQTVSFATRPRVSLQHKLLVLTVLVAVLPTLICVSWINSLTRNAMNQHHARNVQLLAVALAEQLATEGQMPNERIINARISGFNLDQRLSFIIISDPTQSLVYRRAIQAHEWMEYQQWLDASGENLMVPITEPVRSPASGE